MTDRDKIKEWMREAGAGPSDVVPQPYSKVVDIFVRVVERAVAAEREACAELCDYLDDDLPDGLAGWQFGEAIRARSKA